MRGSPEILAGDLQCGRIIPAHAGLTIKSPTCLASSRDHPRACGAHRMALRLTPMPLGSSPRMRGSLGFRYFTIRLRGIIPAHAGLTALGIFHRSAGRDHPRACGAHSSKARQARRVMGSSPRMRGSPDRLFTTFSQLGIIPAHAGLTRPCTHHFLSLRDHPRACGAHGMTR